MTTYSLNERPFFIDTTLMNIRKEETVDDFMQALLDEYTNNTTSVEGQRAYNKHQMLEDTIEVATFTTDTILMNLVGDRKNALNVKAKLTARNKSIKRRLRLRYQPEGIVRTEELERMNNSLRSKLEFIKRMYHTKFNHQITHHYSKMIRKYNKQQFQHRIKVPKNGYLNTTYVYEIKLSIKFPEIFDNQGNSLLAAENWQPRILFFPYKYKEGKYLVLNETLSKNSEDLVNPSKVIREKALNEQNRLTGEVKEVRHKLNRKFNISDKSFINSFIKKNGL